EVLDRREPLLGASVEAVGIALVVGTGPVVLLVAEGVLAALRRRHQRAVPVAPVLVEVVDRHARLPLDEADELDHGLRFARRRRPRCRRRRPARGDPRRRGGCRRPGGATPARRRQRRAPHPRRGRPPRWRRAGPSGWRPTCWACPPRRPAAPGCTRRSAYRDGP